MKPPETPKPEHITPTFSGCNPVPGGRSPGRVSATDLRRLIECRRACWYASQAPFETAAPTLGLAVGQVVHTCRAELSEASWQRYIGATHTSDLWSSEIEASNRALIADVFDRHVFLDAFGDRAVAARLKFTSLLLAIERQRAIRGGDLLATGLSGEALAVRVLPFEVEVPVYDGFRDFVGVCDEVWSDGKYLIPVELKTSPPTEEHLLANRAQAAAYGFLFNTTSGLKVRECRVHYLTQGKVDSFRLDRRWLQRIPRLVDGVRSNRAAEAPPKGRPSPAVCGYCAFQAICPESKAPTLAESLDSLFRSEAVA